eukprot:15235393-Alexandrium_andersonii.AAC.1
MFSPPYLAGGPPRTMWIDGQRLVFGPPEAAEAAVDAASAPASAAPAAGGGHLVDPAADQAAQAGNAPPPPQPVDGPGRDVLSERAAFEAAADARVGPV